MSPVIFSEYSARRIRQPEHNRAPVSQPCPGHASAGRDRRTAAGAAQVLAGPPAGAPGGSLLQAASEHSMVMGDGLSGQSVL